MALSDVDLLAAVAGDRGAEIEEELAGFDAAAARARNEEVGLEAICRCDPDYPGRLLELEAPPAALHVAGGLARFRRLVAADPVAVIGTRRASDYGNHLLSESAVLTSEP